MLNPTLPVPAAIHAFEVLNTRNGVPGELEHGEPCVSLVGMDVQELTDYDSKG